MDWFKHIDMEKVIGWRRWLHAHAELSFNEFETSEFIAKRLSEMDGIEVLRLTKTGIVGILECGKPGKVIGLRADIDALNLTEEANVDFKSQNEGVMHACGHDAHAAMLLGAASVLSKMRSGLSGVVKFIFQHAEETPPGGALDILAIGLLDDVEHYFAVHVVGDTKIGVIGARSGSALAACDSYKLKIKGKGSHASTPQSSIDALSIGANVIVALNQIVSRNISPLESVVISHGVFKCGSANNVIPDTAELQGSIRTFNADIRDLAEKRIRTVVDRVCTAFDAGYELSYGRGYPSLINDERCYRLAKAAAAEVVPECEFKQNERALAGDDYAYYLEKAPGVMVFIGCGDDETCTFINHHPKFKVNEDCLIHGLKMYTGYTMAVMNETDAPLLNP